jgi:hypothetical protein
MSKIVKIKNDTKKNFCVHVGEISDHCSTQILKGNSLTYEISVSNFQIIISNEEKMKLSLSLK